MPIVSVVMPAYNEEAHINEAIESILNQSLGDFEFIIINDGSDDKTEEIIEKFKNKDARIICEKNDKNMGVSYSLNRGMDLAKGKYIARMDADDVADPERLEKQLEYMEQNPNCGVVGTNYISVDEETNEEIKIVKPENDYQIRLCGLYDRMFCHPTVMMRRDAFKENDLKYSTECDGAEGLELFQRAKRFMEFHNVQDFLMRCRLSDNRLTERQKNKRAMLKNKVCNTALREIVNEDFYIPLFTKLSFTLPELKESLNELGELALMELKEDCPFNRKEIHFACAMIMEDMLKRISLPNDYLKEAKE